MGISFSSFLKVAPYVLKINKPIMLRSKHGVGKSELVYQLGNDLKLPVIERRVSQMTEGDLLGLPSIKNGSTTWNLADWYVRACNEPALIFFDEVDRGPMEVTAGIFELTDSRKIAGRHLHPDTVIVSAINGGSYGAQYQVREMDPAELDRWTVFDIEPTVEDFLKWGKDNLVDVVWDFINHNHAHLWHDGEFEPSKVYPTPRSWKRYNDCLVASDLLADIKNISKDIVLYLGQGFVGFEAAVAFIDFIETYDRQVTVEDVVNLGKLDGVRAFSLNDHCAMVEKIENSQIFKNILTDVQVKNIVAYLDLMPAEVAMKMWDVITNSDNCTENVVKIHGTKTPSGQNSWKSMLDSLVGEFKDI